MRHLSVTIVTSVVVICTTLMISSATAAAPRPAATPSLSAGFATYQRGSRLVRLPDGRDINLFCVGKGSPTVILEAGIGESAYNWWPVHQEIGKLTRVCAYDRAGLGRSSPGPKPRDTQSEVMDLEAMLRAAGVRPPYVLVGHSMGAYNMRLFASRNISDVRGMVLVDPSVEDQVPILEAAAPAIAQNDNNAVIYLRGCADPQRSAETIARCARSAPEDFTTAMAAEYTASHGLSFFQTFLSEVESFLTVDSRQVSTAKRAFGAMPLIVLTRGERSADLPGDQAEVEWTLWNQMHGELAKLSSVGSNRIVAGANHYIHVDKPKAVIDAVGEVLAAARKRSSR